MMIRRRNMDIYEKALALHKEHHGKMEINVKVPMETMEDLSMAYTPGVAQPCREIHNNPETVYDYTWKGNSVAVVSDGTAVLGLVILDQLLVFQLWKVNPSYLRNMRILMLFLFVLIQRILRKSLSSVNRLPLLLVVLT